MGPRCWLIGFMLVLLFTADASAAAKSKDSRGSIKKHTQQSATPSVISRDPYIGAIVVDAVTNRVLMSDNADGAGYPASVVKLMDLLIILEKVQQGILRLTDMVTVTAEAAGIGGSQVYLQKHETFSIDELLYALMLKSANDAATALAIHVAGSPEAFVALMNHKAQQLDMTATRFYSVHGLPPNRGQPRDQSTARDLARLARAVLIYPDTLRYTSTERRTFRNGTFMMDNHNHLLGIVEGCDGLKTGFFYQAGFSIVATARRNNDRIIAVVLGSASPRTRDRKARELLTKGFQMAQLPIPMPVTAMATALVAEKPEEPPINRASWFSLLLIGGGIPGGIAVALIVVGRPKSRQG